MKRNFMLGLMVTVFSANFYISGNSYAAVKGNKLESISIPTNLTAINTISNSVRLLGSQAPLIQAYGLIILQQPEISIEAMSSLTNRQKFAKNNVREWIDEYNPKLLDLNQQLMQFSIKFNNYYDKMYGLSEDIKENKEARESFRMGFHKLQAQAKTVKDNLESKLSDIRRFHSLLNTDSDEFAEKAEEAIQSLKGTNGNIVQLRADIKKNQEEIQAELIKILNSPNEITKGSINIGKQIFTIGSTSSQTKTVDLVAINSLSDTLINSPNNQVKKSAVIIEQKQKELTSLIQKLSESQIQATEITIVEDQVKEFTLLIQKQINTLEYLMKDWEMFNEKMTQIETDLAKEKIDVESIQRQLVQLKQINAEVYKQTRQFEDFTTNIEIIKQ
ncbi:enterotoxin [Bacillus thuringiensis serovar yunnanensis]|nr:enterotoxin [Bacillus thuringiensis serovar yunnanensis]